MCTPTLTWILLSSGNLALRSLSALWIPTAHWTALRALGNSARKESPIALTSLPSCALKFERRSRLCSSRSWRASLSFFWERAV
jgi:hypothetical protein